MPNWKASSVDPFADRIVVVSDTPPSPAVLLRDTPEDLERLAAALQAFDIENHVGQLMTSHASARAIIERLRDETL